MTTEQNKQVVKQLFETLNHGQEAMTEARTDLFTPDEEMHLLGQSLDHEAHKHFDNMLFTAFPDIHFTLEDLIAEGDKVAARFRVRGSQQGEYQGVPATGKTVSITGTGIYRLKDGRIIEQWLEYDQLGVLQQLGVMPAAGAAA